MDCHQCGLSSGWLSSGWFFFRMDTHQVGLSSGVDSRQVCLSSGWLSSVWVFIRMDSHQAEDGLSSGWALIRCSHDRVVCDQGGLSSAWSSTGMVPSGWSVIMVVFYQGGLSSGRFSIRVVCHRGILSSVWSFDRGSTVRGLPLSPFLHMATPRVCLTQPLPAR